MIRPIIGGKMMSIEFRNSLLGFNKDDVLNYVHHKDNELKKLSSTLNSRIEELQHQLDTLKSEHLAALGTIGSLTHEKDVLQIKVDEYDKKSANIEDMSAKIGKLYLASKSTAKTIVANAEQSSTTVNEQTAKNLKNIENTQVSLKEIAESILSASQNFVSQIDDLQSSLSAVKKQVSNNDANTARVSDEFAELYAKLG